MHNMGAIHKTLQLISVKKQTILFGVYVIVLHYKNVAVPKLLQDPICPVCSGL